MRYQFASPGLIASDLPSRSLIVLITPSSRHKIVAPTYPNCAAATIGLPRDFATIIVARSTVPKSPPPDPMVRRASAEPVLA